MNPILENMIKRRSVRKFQKKEIPQTVLEEILMAGTWAPSGRNTQCWQFTVLRKEENIQKLARAVGKAAGMGPDYCFYDPACYILVSCPKGYRNSAQDCCAATENILLAAEALGVQSCWINQVRVTDEDPTVRQLLTGFGVPEDHHVEVSISLGYGTYKPEAPERRQGTVVYGD